MNIRMARETDINEINKLLRQVCLIHHNGRADIFKVGKKYTDEQLIEIINDKNKPVLVAADENDLVMGYAFCMFRQHRDDNILTDIKTLYIDDLCVDENKRGQHIGKALYNATIDFAKENGCYNVTLNVWALNENAVKFYRSCGMNVLKTEMEQIL